MNTDEHRPRLPYIDNAMAVLITLGINVIVVFVFFWPGGVTLAGVIQDTVICVVITVVVDMAIVYFALKRMRARGVMPAKVPESRLMQRLPKNPVALGLAYVLFFGLLTAGLNVLVLWFFGMEAMAFVPWITYKLIYATVLSIKVVEYCIFRFVQPDWAQAGRSADTADKAQPDAGQRPLKPVKDPLPKISVFKAMFGSVTSTIAMNIIIGSLLGGASVTADAMVVIAPSTVEGIPVTGFVFGFITGLLTTNAILKAVNTAIRASIPTSASAAPEEPPPMPAPDRRFSWMPKARVPLTCLICAAVMAFSMVALPTIMTLFGLSILNFYQFTIFMVIYSSLLGKPLGYLLTKRCSQPDYVLYVIKKHEQKQAGRA